MKDNSLKLSFKWIAIFIILIISARNCFSVNLLSNDKIVRRNILDSGFTKIESLWSPFTFESHYTKINNTKYNKSKENRFIMFMMIPVVIATEQLSEGSGDVSWQYIHCLLGSCNRYANHPSPFHN